MDEFTDRKLRVEFAQDHGIIVGLYSYGCFDPSRIDPSTTVGRYCSFARTSAVLNRNHGTDFIANTPFLYNAGLRVVRADRIAYRPCVIGDDVWIGHNATLTPSAQNVGRGAVVGAGAVVTSDVPPYAIVAGIPARVVRFRFEPSIIEKVEETRWWEWDPAQLKQAVRKSEAMIYRPSDYFAQST